MEVQLSTSSIRHGTREGQPRPKRREIEPTIPSRLEEMRCLEFRIDVRLPLMCACCSNIACALPVCGPASGRGQDEGPRADQRRARGRKLLSASGSKCSSSHGRNKSHLAVAICVYLVYIHRTAKTRNCTVSVFVRLQLILEIAAQLRLAASAAATPKTFKLFRSQSRNFCSTS